MKKIPVLATIQAAYQFAFAQLGAIIGLIWLPMVLVTVMGFFIEQRYYAAVADALASNNFARLGPAMLGLFCYFIAALLLYAMMYVSVIQLALGQRKEPVLVHFAFGPLEWRLFRAITSLVGSADAGLVIGLAVNSLLYFGVARHGVPVFRSRAWKLAGAGAGLSGAGLCRPAFCLSVARAGGERRGPCCRAPGSFRPAISGASSPSCWEPWGR